MNNNNAIGNNSEPSPDLTNNLEIIVKISRYKIYKRRF